MAHIFWVEDQTHWLTRFRSILQTTDFGDGASSNTVDVFKFVEAACQAIQTMPEAPDLAILDANMGGNDNAGFLVSRHLHDKWPGLPIIYLSEHSGTGIEQQAFEQAIAQDFIAKHQTNIEQVLCWRIKAVLRQQKMQQQSPGSEEQTLVSGPLTIDLTSWHVYWYGERLMNPNNAQRPLAPTPRKMLKVLVERSPRAVNTDQMAEALSMESLSYASYRQHIKTLRHSLDNASLKQNKESFLSLCKRDIGLVTFGDEHAYCWRNPESK